MNNILNINDIVRWWEKKRLLFNIIISALGIIIILDIKPTSFGFKDFLGIIIWGIGANIFYSLGILLEIFDFYYFKGTFRLNKMRWFFLITGILISCYITFINILSYYDQLIIG